MRKGNKSILIVALIIIFSIVIRFANLSFPFFTAEEARIAHRSYTLVKGGSDELGRKFPLVFNSLDDYQLPLTSYITMIGIAIFGKNDLGARIPFVLIGTLLVFLTFKISKFFNTDSLFGFVSVAVVASSPTLIFLSKTPNEIIVLVFIFTLLFYLLVNNRNMWLILGTMILASLVSKFAWFILFPFMLYIFWILKLRPKRQALFSVFAILITLSAFVLFLTIPQSTRSLSENYFSIFSDVTIRNGINTLRGQGIQSGWPGLVEKLLFNKLSFLFVGVLHWLSHFLNPAFYFGQFDETGRLSFSYFGAWAKILIIPAAWGLFSVIRSGDRKSKLLLFLPVILTYPATFIYPKYSLELTVLTLPFIAITIAAGFIKIIQFNKRIAVLLFIFLSLELVFNLSHLSPEYKNTNVIRPGWVKEITIDIFNSSKNRPGPSSDENSQVAVSDDIVSDVAAYLNWYTHLGNVNPPLNIDWPYKFRQYNVSNIEIIGSAREFRVCGKDEKQTVFVSLRDLNKIKQDQSIKVVRIYQDYIGQEKAYLINESVCLN